MREISDEEFQATTATGTVLIDFFSTWCQPCKPVTKLLELVEPDFPDFTFVKVNVDACPDATKACYVGALPTLVLFKDGAEIKNYLGGMTESALREWLKV